MKPGIPWSVKGIEQQAREAAKEAARQSGMTIGEWLNTMILDSADGAEDLERRYRRQPYRQKPMPGSETGEGEEVTLRLEQIADQLNDMASLDRDTAIPRQASPEDETVLRAIIERLDAHEQHTTSALGNMQERLEEVSQRLRGAPDDNASQHADDVPGYRALDAALRNIIEHIEISEKRTCESIRSLQERVSESMDQRGGEFASAAAVGELEQRVTELAERMDRADAALPNDLDEVGRTEQRLRGLVEEANQAAGKLDPDEAAAQLRLEMEQLAATVSQASSHALSDLGGRIEQLESELKRQFSERDQASQREAAALSGRIAATEKRLDHLTTIEQSVAKLARSLEEDGSEGGRAGGASPELQALEEGLKAVRASAEYSDQRTQETLQAVHDTLEHIVGKLAELETDEHLDDQETVEAPAETLVGDHAQDEAEPFELLADAAEDDESSPDVEAESTPDTEAETGVTLAMEPEDEGFTFPETPAAQAGIWGADEEAQSEPHGTSDSEPESEPNAVSETAEAAVREDYIAAARRAAQASSRNSGFNRFSKRLSGAGTNEPARGKAQKRGFVSMFLSGLRGGKAKSGVVAQPQTKITKRKRLIFCGLVLLAAASAYGVQHHRDLIPDVMLLGDSPVAPQASHAVTGAPVPLQAEAALSPSDQGTTASISPRIETADRRDAVHIQALPAEIGPDSLRQAAAAGDAVAQFVVAGRYLEGKAVPRDEDLAAQWYTRAAEQGLAAAQYRLGSMYEHGRGMALDRKQAIAWYEQAAGHGNINAMHNLAVLLTDGASGQRNYALAASWFGKAAARGLKDSQFNLAVLHEQGLGVPKNPQEAAFWYSVAAVQGDGEARIRAKALEEALAPEAARKVRARLLGWRPLQADRDANVVPINDTSWLETS